MKLTYYKRFALIHRSPIQSYNSETIKPFNCLRLVQSTVVLIHREHGRVCPPGPSSQYGVRNRLTPYEVNGFKPESADVLFVIFENF